MADTKTAKDAQAALAALGAWQKAICGVMERREVKLHTGSETRVKQSLKESSDVNAIMRKYLSSGEIPEYRAGTYGDFSSGEDYHAAYSKVVEAQQAFDALPSRVRQAAGNDPGRLLDLVSDPNLRTTAIALGLIEAGPDDLVEEAAAVEGNAAGETPAEAAALEE